MRRRISEHVKTRYFWSVQQDAVELPEIDRLSKETKRSDDYSVELVREQRFKYLDSLLTTSQLSTGRTTPHQDTKEKLSFRLETIAEM